MPELIPTSHKGCQHSSFTDQSHLNNQIKGRNSVTMKLLVAFALIQLTCLVQCQKLCKFRNSIEEPDSSRWNFIENFSLQKCLLVENFGHFPNSKLLLHECSYGTKALREQKIYLEKSSLGGFLLKVDPGMGEMKFCLTMKRGLLHNAECRSNSFEQTWKFKPVRDHPNQYLIENYASHECLIPATRRPGTAIESKACNSYETEQIWKVCTQA